MFSTLGKRSVRYRAVCPFGGRVKILLVNNAPVLGSHNRAKTYPVAVLGLAMAIPVFSDVSVSAAKSVLPIVLKTGSTPTSDRSFVPERNWRTTVVCASLGE